MFSLIECVAHQHDYRLVLLAATICALGNITLFVLLKRASECVELRRRHWLAVAAIAEGVGVWATHFVAMLAYRGAMPMRFDAALTILSAALAVAAFWLTFRMLGRKPDAKRAGVAGLIATIGVALMHFTGMASIIAPAAVRYALSPIAISFLLAWGAFAGSFFSFGALRGWRRVFAPAGLTILAVVALHFTAMSATTLVPDPTIAVTAGDGSAAWLIPAIVFATLALIGLVLASSFVERLLTDLRGLTDATLEGLMIVHDNVIVEINQQMSTLVGTSYGALIGSRPEDWLQFSDQSEVTGDRSSTTEAVIRNSSEPEKIVEVAIHEIEYRGRSCQVLAIRDLTQRKEAEREVAYMASHDSLTDLPNRACLNRALAEAARRTRHTDGFALLALDLDRFKAVNDLFGHAAGDDILKRVAAMLKAVVRTDDIVARIGGDEFLILQRHVEDDESVRRLTARILDSFAREMDSALDPTAVGVSIGAAVFPRDGSDPETLRHNADLALYRAKHEGRGTACFFDPGMDQQVRERRAMEHDLRHALQRDEFHLVFQPLVSTAFSATVGFEALLRWTHPERGNVPPDLFIPVAEETGAILPIGEWVLREACRCAAGWSENLSIAVNVSPIQFQVANLAAVVRSAVEDSGLDPRRLELEITESSLLRNRETTLTTLHAIKAMGIRIVMDDFGTGYSSLSNLQSFPFDKIKIDRSFIAALAKDDAARSIIRAIVGLGKSLNLPVVAEGVETDEQRRMVLEEGCPQAQGYLFGQPHRLSDRVEKLEITTRSQA
ncbi:bifunctional diguanylate cyclase/phosphodiesterase [Sphingomonas nostoxanthinifaciens]|uniref:bifunctional diguanylate cyclase/phosphodiesterase n=1 Tax=Sphingomonas nostoxanthinifaciens TaxID=2872652 RepID=UPI001CC1CD75|nr:bifunctional diguanylate cyclase/phosphodiesterase [Sphingomonas nostoxanthinifaciens]UAK25247.1 EAL domain-containing protein [Sphingomonas nostoxanthinifaciens]